MPSHSPLDSPFVPSQVRVHRCMPGRRDGGHEQLTHIALAERLAVLLGVPLESEGEGRTDASPGTYLVPDDTLMSVDEAKRLGVHGPQHLFGGVVPQPFAATKTITHSLVDPAAEAPVGWSRRFGEQVGAVVLPGFSAFSRDDARRAGLALLKDGKVRVKEADGIGGSGQSVVGDEAGLAALLRRLDAEGAWTDGVVLERNLNDVVTHSVGQVCVGRWLASYCGLQRLTRNHRGEAVYGGSTLQVVRGGYDALAALGLDGLSLLAVQQARAYQQAAFACFDGMFASRCNYDVVQGVDDRGEWRSGVLEQSWRIGGASGAELAALEAFAADPALRSVSASTHEVHDADVDVPAGAIVHFRGTDARAGPLLKYSRLEAA